MGFHVTGTLELFEDDFVHFGASIDQRRGDNRQAAALFDITRRTKEAFWLLKGVGIDTTGEHFARAGHHGVVSTRQASNRVEQNDHVFLVLNQTLGFLDNHFSDLHVTRWRLIKG